MEDKGKGSEHKFEISVFNEKKIRKVFHEDQWWFCVKDIIEAVTDTVDSGKYIQTVRQRDAGLAAAWLEWVQPLTIETAGGKQMVNCATAEGIFRIIQSVPSPRAEPFKRWLAKVATERLEETQDPELAIKRAVLQYRAAGREDDWINARIKTVQSRKELTDEWKQRGIEGREYGTLSGVIAKQTFGLTPEEHKDHKGLPKNQNLRDHMTDIELILTMLGEKSTAQIAQARDAQGFEQNKEAANAGGSVAGAARSRLERQLKETVVSKSNFLPEGPKRIGK